MADGDMKPIDSDFRLDKRQVAASFSKAARQYDSMAHLQRDLGQRLLEKALPQLRGRVLDLGSGTGYFSQKLAELEATESVLAMDLAEGMLRYSREHRQHPKMAWLAGDAEHLPLASGSVDAIFANLSLQWCQSPERLFAELSRVLRPGGCLAFTTLGPGTLQELRQAWQTVDTAAHVNQFLDQQALLATLPETLQLRDFYAGDQVLTYAHLQQLLQELKGIGAQNRLQGRPQGLGSRARLAALAHAYEDFRHADGLLPATYEVYQGIFYRNEDVDG